VTLSRPVKLLIGAATLWPLAYIVLFFVFVLTMVLSLARAPAPAPPGPSAWPFAGFLVLMVLHMGTALLIFGLMAFYLLFVFKSDRVAADSKMMWALVIVFGNIVAMPVFFYLHIWPERASGQAAA
jgi:hypothetical protein